MHTSTIGDQVRTFAKIAYDMYRHGWNTGDFSQFINLLNKVGVDFIDPSENLTLDGRAGYKHILKLIHEKIENGDRLSLDLVDQAQRADRVLFTFNYTGMQNGAQMSGKRQLELGVRNAKIISYELTELA